MTQPQVSTVVADPASVDAAIQSRFSARAFLPTPVLRADIEHILDVARRAAAGTNTQPWKVYVLQGASRDSLVEKAVATHDAIRADPALAAEYREEYDYYPEKWVSPYIDRRRENGPHAGRTQTGYFQRGAAIGLHPRQRRQNILNSLRIVGPVKSQKMAVRAIAIRLGRACLERVDEENAGA